MNILFLIFSFNTGGIEKQLIEMSNNMAKKGHNVSLIVVNHNYEEKLFAEFSKKVSIIKFNRPVGNSGRFYYMVKLLKLCIEKKIDVIHAQEPSGVILSALTEICIPHLKVVETIHDIGEYKDYSKMTLKLSEIFCSRYIAISKSVMNEIGDRGIGKNRITLIYNAINTDKYKNSLNSIKKIKKQDKIILGNVARFFPSKKGQNILIKAVEKLKADYLYIECRFAGDVYRGQENEWDKTLEYVKKHGLEDNIIFEGNVEDVPEFLSQVNIFILPSIYEGFGISLIEAMSTGLLCIASNIEGPAEIISNSSLGILFDSGDADDLAEKIKYAIEHYTEYDRKAISDYVSSNFSIDSMVDHHIEVYKSL